MVLVGVECIFKFIDEKKEMDEGYVILVNVKENKNGEIEECMECIGMWVWKYLYRDGIIIYIKFNGEVVFDDVDFGYNDEKIILYNIKFYVKFG